jgi:hypothetical protein
VTDEQYQKVLRELHGERATSIEREIIEYQARTIKALEETVQIYSGLIEKVREQLKAATP